MLTYMHTDVHICKYYRMLLLSGHRPYISFSFLVQSLMCKYDDEWARLNPHISAEAQTCGSSLLALGLLHATRVFASNRALIEAHGLLGELVSIQRNLATTGEISSFQHVLCVVLEQKSRS
jgi:hypothetical protein